VREKSKIGVKEAKLLKKHEPETRGPKTSPEKCVWRTSYGSSVSWASELVAVTGSSGIQRN